MLGTIIGIGAAAGKAIANNNAKNEQKKENRELMKYQADLNQQQAYYSTGLAKDLWDYTNYENTVKHIKAAGLSPALIYGGGWFFNLDYDKEILAKALAHKADELPLIIELVSKDKKYVICHADYPCDEYEFGKPVDNQQVIWNRERISNSQEGIVKEIKGADTFIFGHTPPVS